MGVSQVKGVSRGVSGMTDKDQASLCNLPPEQVAVGQNNAAGGVRNPEQREARRKGWWRITSPWPHTVVVCLVAMAYYMGHIHGSMDSSRSTIHDGSYYKCVKVGEDSKDAHMQLLNGR